MDGPRTDVTDTVSTSYDAERRGTQITDALGKITKQAYDADGRLIRIAAQLGSLWLILPQLYSHWQTLESMGPCSDFPMGMIRRGWWAILLKKELNWFYI